MPEQSAGAEEHKKRLSTEEWRGRWGVNGSCVMLRDWVVRNHDNLSLMWHGGKNGYPCLRK